MPRCLSLAAAALALAVAAACGADAAPGAVPSSGPATTTPQATATASADATPSAMPGPTEPAPTARFEVRRGKVVTGPRTVEVRVGTRVVLEVVTDIADELHVHGYDKEVAVASGPPARLVFTADIPGVFEVELHSGVPLCHLRVR